MDILVGDDLNRNGVLDSSEPDKDENGQVDPGIIEYLTVYSREPNTHSDGTALTNINSPTQLRTLLQSNFGGGRASSIMTQLYRTTGQGTNVTTTFVPSNGLLQFYQRSGLSETEFAEIYPDITVGAAPFTQGLVNINTASVTVLSCLPGMDSGSAQQVVSYRQSNPNNLGTIAWIVDALGRGSAAIQGLEGGDYITTRSFQFAADIAAVGPYGRGYRRVKFIFDISDGTARILYRQDLTRLGWALGQDVRQRLLGKEAS
jgi:hypothetical protein